MYFLALMSSMEFLLVYQQEEFPKNHLAIHYILHGGSPNWVLERNLSEYHWTDLGIQEGAFHLRQDRLESHSDLWNEQEENIIRLLTQSNSELVLQFASKVFFSNTQWYENIKTSFVLTLLGKESEATAMLGIDIAKKIYDPNQPNTELLLALLKTTYLPAQELALTWVQANPVKLLANWEIVNHLLISTCKY